MKPIVTIGVCVRNGASTLPKAIESIMSQDYPHALMEVIFVDDGSRDETLSIINSYASKIGMNVKIFHHEWKGIGFSRNVVVKNASGKYIVWVDSDMILPKDHIRKQVEFMEKHPKVGIGKARLEPIPKNSLVAALEGISLIIRNHRTKWSSSMLPGTGGSIFRLDALRQVNGFDNGLKGVGEDQEIAYRIVSVGWQIKKSDAYFFERIEKNWKDLWIKYIWYGYGNLFLYRKNKLIFRLYKMIPPTSFLAGLYYSFRAYKITKRKIAFLLPIHFVFKSIAWCLGFTRGYQHLKAKSM